MSARGCAAQDWNYLAGECMELTLELSGAKWPPATELPQLFADNLAPLLAYPLAAAFGGLRRARARSAAATHRVGYMVEDIGYMVGTGLAAQFVRFPWHAVVRRSGSRRRQYARALAAERACAPAGARWPRRPRAPAAAGACGPRRASRGRCRRAST